jgi:hypothetical protein
MKVKSEKWLKRLLVIGLLLLDWAALDDITTGNEPNYWGEYLTLVVSGVIFLWLWRKRKS